MTSTEALERSSAPIDCERPGECDICFLGHKCITNDPECTTSSLVCSRVLADLKRGLDKHGIRIGVSQLVLQAHHCMPESPSPLRRSVEC